MKENNPVGRLAREVNKGLCEEVTFKLRLESNKPVTQELGEDLSRVIR